MSSNFEYFLCVAEPLNKIPGYLVGLEHPTRAVRKITCSDLTENPCEVFGLVQPAIGRRVGALGFFLESSTDTSNQGNVEASFPASPAPSTTIRQRVSIFFISRIHCINAFSSTNPYLVFLLNLFLVSGFLRSIAACSKVEDIQFKLTKFENSECSFSVVSKSLFASKFCSICEIILGVRTYAPLLVKTISNKRLNSA